MTSTTIAVNSGITEEELTDIKTFEDAIATLEAHGITGAKSSDFGNGFTVLDNKDVLVGNTFVILDAAVRDGEYGDRGYISLEIVTKANEKFVLNDGSTGIFAQMVRIIEKRAAEGVALPACGILVENGLTKSTYYINDDEEGTFKVKPEGKGWYPANTYYLS